MPSNDLEPAKTPYIPDTNSHARFQNNNSHSKYRHIRTSTQNERTFLDARKYIC